MTSPRLQILERQMARRQTPEPAPAPAASSLGEAFDALLQQRIDEALAVERERHSAQIQRLMDQIQNQPQRLPPSKGKEPMEFTRVICRDHFNRILLTETTIEGRDDRIIMEVTKRDELGSIVSSRAFHLAAGEVYKPGKSRLPDPRHYQDAEPR